MTDLPGVWKSVPKNAEKQIKKSIEQGFSLKAWPGDSCLFFRADDIGVPGTNFFNMLDLFILHRTPLALAVVPTWITEPRWNILSSYDKNSDLWIWHQHGWRHKNHEPVGKKQEFGPSRSYRALEKDILAGKKRLESILKDHFYPVFTPPWNRCSKDALVILRKSGFHAVSRSAGAASNPPSGLPDFAVTIDLNTRKEKSPDQMWDNLLREIQGTIASGMGGLMLHHQRMNSAAFHLLESLLSAFSGFPRIRCLSFRGLIP